MNVLLTVIFVIGLILFIINERIRYRRFKNELELGSIYGRMEEYFVINNIQLNRNYINFLKTYKNVSTNPGMIDIELLIISQIMLERRGVDKDVILEESRKAAEIVNKLGDEFKSLVEEFNQCTDSLIKLSILRPDFLWFIVKLFLKDFAKRGVAAFSRMKKEFSFVINNEMAISHQSDNLIGC